MFFFPFLRELLLFAGMSAASRENIDSLLRRRSGDGSPPAGRAVVLVVGGAQEALYSQPGVFQLILAKRFGFVKKALQHGAPLVPCFGFGENDLFLQTVAPEGSLMRRMQDAFRSVFTFSLPVARGRGIFNYSFGVLPQRRPVTVVVGAPVEPDGGPKEFPSAEEIQKLHAKYVAALVDLFERHKGDYGLSETDHLEII